MRTIALTSAFPFADVTEQEGAEWCIAVLSVVSNDFATFTDWEGHASVAIVDSMTDMFASFANWFAVTFDDNDRVLGGALGVLG
jgi:hypothetical protein